MTVDTFVLAKLYKDGHNFESFCRLPVTQGYLSIPLTKFHDKFHAMMESCSRRRCIHGV